MTSAPFVFTDAAFEYERAVAQARSRRRETEGEKLTEAQDRIELSWRYLREGLERRAELFRLSLDGIWDEAQLAEHLGLTVERVEAIIGTRGGERS